MNSRRSLIVRWAGPVILAWAVTSNAHASPPGDPFAECRQALAQRPGDYESSYCFYRVTLDRRLWDTAPPVFDRLMTQQPDNFWLPLAFGHTYRNRDAARAEALYRRSADGFRRAGHAAGEVVARSSLRDLLFPLGRVEDAQNEVRRIVEIAGTVDDPLLKARAWTAEATQIQQEGGDLGLAYRLLKQGEDAIFPDGPYLMKRTLLSSLGSVAFRLGRLDEALAVFERLDALAAVEGEARLRANAQYNILNTVALKETLLPSPDARQRIAALTERTLATGLAAQSFDVTLKAHRAMAELLAHETGSRGAALDHVRRCLDLAVTIRVPHDEAVCSWVLASLVAADDPKASRAAERRALEATERANNPRTRAFSAGRRMRLSWSTKPRDLAIRDSLDAIDAIEALRDLQDAPDSSAGLFSTWTIDYRWLAGRLLESSQGKEIDLAFAITERMRARSLLDVRTKGHDALSSAHSAIRARRTILEDIAAVQRRLMNAAIEPADRRTSLARLEALERQDQEAQRRIAVSAAGRRPVRPSFADLAAVQSTLGEHEALLSFQVGLWETYDGEFGGGSWLLMATRHARSAWRLPARTDLAPLVPVFTGLLSRDDGLDAAAGVRLYSALLEPALRQLPAGITRLIVIPDDVLHHLPFDALRATREAPPLAARYELVVAPSATLWRHWRMAAPGTAARRTLALADPALETPGVHAIERNATLQEGLRAGRLPYARREARALRRHVRGIDILAGARASERAVKERDLRDYDILHFAAHAIADEANPDRSAVLLAPGADSEDGLLQSREIEELDLEGRIVVLSTCRSASGAVLNGEGVQSLARAFFAAGAYAVIGSRWPIRDDDAAWFFEAFYRHLGNGASLAEALAQAKIEAIATERPAAIWAGVVLLGNGDIRPFPDGRHLAAAHQRVILLTAVITLLFASALWHTSRARTSVTA